MDAADAADVQTLGAQGSELRYFVGGMDCASCANKIGELVARTSGADGGRISFVTQTLSVTLDERVTPRGRLEADIRALGYEPELQKDEGARSPAETDRVKPWYRTPQGRLVLLSGALLTLAFVLSFVTPFATWAYVAATLIGAAPLVRKAVNAARLGDPFTINTLVSLAALGAVLIGEAPEGALVVFLFAVGELLEGVAAGRARSGIAALTKLAPKTARLLEGGQTREIPAESLRVGDTIQVSPGGRVPADGVILGGHSYLNDAPVTGESVSVAKGPGDEVFAGSLNDDGLLTVRVARDSSDNTLARIIHLVEEAQASKAPTARFIDAFSRRYTPAVMLVALLVAVLPPLFGGAWDVWLYKALALLLIGCPCALVLSVPAAVTSALAAGARRGLLVKGGAALETIGKVRTVAFDKTGTLTEGRPRVSGVFPLTASEDEVLRLAAAVEGGSSHPLAKAILEKAAAQGLNVPTAEDAQAVKGEAVTARVEGRLTAVGSPRYAAKHVELERDVQEQIGALEAAGQTVVVVFEENIALGIIAIRDEPREGAREALADLKRLGVTPVMLTGDNARAGGAVAAALGISVEAELMPAEKLEHIRALGARGGVAMVGDGVNDAPALAQADVGISMGGGAEVALETADAALLKDSVAGVGELVRLSRATLRNIRQNVVFALGLKAVFLVTTLLGVTGLWLAVLSDTGATALVTANALRLLSFGSSSAGRANGNTGENGA